MAQPDYDRAVAFALDLLQRKLAQDLTYHNFWHTRDDVMLAAVVLGEQSRLDATELQLLRVAAAFHDIGFLDRYQGHEITSVRMAAQQLPQFSFGSEAIEAIMGMILATRLPQSPRNHLEALLADADLDVLGRDDFFSRNQALRSEQACYGRPTTDLQWLQQQHNFLRDHRYFTAVARARRSAGKRANLAIIEQQLAGFAAA